MNYCPHSKYWNVSLFFAGDVEETVQVVAATKHTAKERGLNKYRKIEIGFFKPCEKVLAGTIAGKRVLIADVPKI